MPLIRICPPVRPVALAGGSYLVAELRVRDLADLLALAAAAAPWPPDSVPPREGTDPAAWGAAMRAAWEAALAWPPSLDSAEGHSGAGIVHYVRTCLYRHQPGLSVDDCAAIAAAMTGAEWMALGRAAWGPDPLDELEALMGPRPPDGRPPVDWEVAVYEVAKDLGISYEAVFDMTLGQFASARRAGQPKERGRFLREGEDPERARREQYRRFHGVEPPEPKATNGASP